MSRFHKNMIRKCEIMIKITGEDVQNPRKDDQIDAPATAMSRFHKNIIRKCEIVIRITVEMIRIREKMIKLMHQQPPCPDSIKI